MNKFMLIFLFISSSSIAGEFNMKAGISLSDENSARPEVDLPDPLGILRLEYETENNTTVFCEHISSIQKRERGSGLNHCGFLIKL